MKSKIFIVIGLLCSTFLAQGQTGNFFLSNLSPNDEKIDPRSVGMTQDTRGIMYFTNKNGVLEYDGNQWKQHQTPGSVYTVATSGNKLFVGGSFGFGYFNINTGKPLKFKKVIEKQHVFASVIHNNKVIFCNDQEVFVYHIDLDRLDTKSMKIDASDMVSGLHIIDNQVYATTFYRQLFLVQGVDLIPASIALPLTEHLLFSVSAGKDIILGTEEGHLYKYESPEKIRPFALADSAYLQSHVLLNATMAGPDLLALGTLRGGVMFIDAATGATKEIIDYYVGLPDNDVTAIFTDRDKGVWVSHEYGFTRIAPFLPFRSFNHYPGLGGNLLCVHEVEGRLLAGTTLGLYYLKTEDQYEDRVTYVAQNITTTTKPNTKTTTTASVEATKETSSAQKERSRKKLFGIFRKKETAEPATTTQPSATSASNPKNIKPAVTQRMVKKTERVLKSRQYRYQKIEGLDGKVTQIILVNGETLIVGLGGAYFLRDLKLEPVFHHPVRFVYHSQSLKQLFISTFDDRTVTLRQNGNGWEETHLADTLVDYISHIFEDNNQNIWLCGKTHVHKMEFVEGSLIEINSIAIHNPLFDETVGLALGNETYLAASGNFLQYQPNGTFKVYDSLTGPKRYFSSEGNFWFNDGHRWRTFNKVAQSLKLEWLGLFPNLRYLTANSKGNGFWLVTADNELFQFVNPDASATLVSNPLFLREVRGEQVRVIKPSNLRLGQSQSEVFFEFTQPNYNGFRATEFRYRVVGLSNKWSEWSNVNNVVPLSFLPPAEYQLEVQSRDALGNESKVELVRFQVLPYYWKRWWFYALEFAFFSILVFISIKLGRSDNRYRVVSQILSLLTVVLLIQFIETGINSFIEIKSSPVMEFLIQLGIALVVFPVEGQLQKFMQLAKEGKFKKSA